MNKNDKSNFDLDIDLLQIAKALWDKAVLILICGIIGAVALFMYAKVMITPRYEANALFYVNNSTISLSSSVRISTGELNAASELVDTYVAILQSRANMEQVIEETGVGYSYEQLRGMVSASAVNSTGLFRVTVNSANPEEARMLANKIAMILPQKISDIVRNSSVVVVDYAVTPHTRVSPSYMRYTAIGFLIGCFACAAVVALIDYFDDVIRDEDYLAKNFDAPVLAIIPDLTAKPSKRYGHSYGYGYGYGNSYEASASKSTARSRGKKDGV